MFATHDIPLTLDSDSGPPFEFKKWNRPSKGTTVSSILKWIAGNMVKTVKQALTKAGKGDSIEAKI